MFGLFKQTASDNWIKFKRTDCYIYLYGKYVIHRKKYRATKFHKLMSRKYRNARRAIKKKIKKDKYVDSDPE